MEIAYRARTRALWGPATCPFVVPTVSLTDLGRDGTGIPTLSRVLSLTCGQRLFAVPLWTGCVRPS